MMRSVASPLAPSRVSCGICRLATHRRPATAPRRAVRSRWRRHVATSSSSSSQAKANANDTKQSIVPPEEPSFALPTAFGIGTVAGALGSLAGMGGGFVMIPLMTSSRLLGLSQHAAHGTSLFAVAATGIAGSLSYATTPGIDIELDSVLALTTAAMITARAGALTTATLSERRLKLWLGVFMLAVAPLVPAKAYLTEWLADENDGSGSGGDEKMEHGNAGSNKETEDEEEVTAQYLSAERIQRLAMSGTIGLGSGFLAGLFGVGGGAVVVPALSVATDLSHYQALGTSLMAMTLPAFVGTVTHYQRGNVAMRVAPALAAGAFAGAYLGGKLGTQIEEDKLRWGFSGLMLTLGLRTITKSF